MHRRIGTFGLLFSALTLATAPAGAYEITQASIAELNRAFDDGTLTAEKLVELCIARIEAYDDQGPALNAVLLVNPNARARARELDAERKSSGPRSPLHGIPVVLKDNFDTADMPTTAGSFLLAGSLPPDDAFPGEEAARRRRHRARQGQHERVRLRRRVELLRRHHPEPARSGAHALGLLGRNRRRGGGRLRAARARHRYRRVGARSVRGERPRRAETDPRTLEP